MQGPDGLIYVGGGSGLLVYDGATWRQVKTRHNERVRDLEIDDHGRVWIGSPSEFGYFERGDDGGLGYHSISDLLPEADRAFGETRFVERLGETLYFNTHQKLFRWADGELSTFDAWDGLFRVAFTANGRFYVAVKDRLYDFTRHPSDGHPPPPEDRWRWPDKARITFLLPWDDQRLLLGTYDDGLYLLGEGEPERFATGAGLKADWPYHAIRHDDGGVIVLTIKAGIVSLDRDGILQDRVNTDSGLRVNGTLGASFDHQGGLWLAQDGAIARVDLGSSIRFYDGDSGVETARDLVEHQGHLLVAGSMGVGLLQTGPAGRAEVVSLNVPLVQESWDLHSTPAGLLIAGFRGVHLASFDYEQQVTTDVQRLFEDTYSYGLYPSPSRPVIYVASETGLGVLIQDHDGWRGLPAVPGIEERPDTIEEDGATVWAGSGAGRYFRLSWRDSETLALDATLDGEQGVPDGNTRVYRLGERLILGTTRGGYRLSPNGALEPDPGFGNDQLGDSLDVFRFFTPDQRRIMAVIGGIYPTWYGEADETGRIRWGGRQLQMLDPGFMSFFSQERDQLWFGRHPNLYRMDWPELDPQPSAGTQVNLRRVSYPDRPGRTRNPSVLLAGTLQPGRHASGPLPHTPDALRFEYAMASFSRPGSNEFRVRLVGLEDAWSPWTRETRRDYTNLPGGDYRFEVQGRNVHGELASAPAFAFSVRPPWYLSAPVRLGYVVAAALLLWLAVLTGQRRRQSRLLETQHRLEAEVAERTAEVRAQARELSELNDAKTRFFANVSHEFRTPLTLARAPLEELARGEAGDLSDRARSYVGMALRNTQTMQSLIGQILDMNRLEAGRMPISVTRDRLAPLVREVVEGFQMHADNAGVTLVVDADPEVEADFDPDHLRKIISNLLSNAVKFTPSGGSVSVVCAAGQGTVEIRVSDTGPGVARADQARIFERYFQGDQTHASRPGTGIGLALVRDLAQLHRGDVELSSEPGQGAHFRVWFPAELPDLRGGPMNRPEPDDKSPVVVDVDLADDDDVPCILIVDDNEELRSFLKMRLGGSYRVLEAGNGRIGLEMARERLPDVVVTDVMMPEMTGLEMTDAIKSDPELEFIPVLMLSARSTRRDTVAGLERGADDYLGKPFDTAELATRVAGLIASRRKLKRRFAQDEGETKVRSGPDPATFAGRAHQVVMENLADAGFGPRDWAQLLHMDRTTLYRKLKGEAGVSPEDYLREQRLLRAAELLAARAGNVSQVAVSVGFNSISYFSRRFRERFGTTPASYAQESDKTQ